MRKRKPGPKPAAPTAAQRRRVELAVAIGMTVDEVAAAIGMPRRSVYRHFAHEIAAGRAKRLLESARRLDAMAEAGNASAARYLHGLIADSGDTPEAADDEWDQVAREITADGRDGPAVNLAQIRDFGKSPAMSPKRDLRSMRQAAMAGDHSAARALLKLYGHKDITAEIKAGKPWLPRVARMVRVLTAGTGAPGTIGYWEFVDENGVIHNDLQHDPPGAHGARVPALLDEAEDGPHE